MTWKDRVPGCFGSGDRIFAGHPLDAQRALELLLTVKQELVPYEELRAAMADFLAREGCDPAHISEQLKSIDRHYRPWF